MAGDKKAAFEYEEPTITLIGDVLELTANKPPNEGDYLFPGGPES